MLYTVIYINRFRLSVHQYHREHKQLSLALNWLQHYEANRAVALHILKFFVSILVAAISVKVGVAYVGGFDATIKPITAVALCVCFLLAFIFALPSPGNQPYSKIRHSISMWWCFTAYMIFGMICSLGQLVLAVFFWTGLYFWRGASVSAICACAQCGAGDQEILGTEKSVHRAA